ncbi:MAG: hypothetical protein IT473_10060, partial [Lysobacter sp.]|nr:hypothetical protein [Lysobacter sp.]
MPARLDDPQTHAIAERALARLRAASPEHARALETPRVAEACAAVAIVSDFALETLLRQPALLARLADDDGASPLPLPALTLDAQAEWPSL